MNEEDTAKIKVLDPQEPTTTLCSLASFAMMLHGLPGRPAWVPWQFLRRMH